MRIVPIVRNDRCRAADAVQAVADLIETEHVSVIIGSLLSSVTIPAAEASQDLGIPIIAPAATDPAVTAVGGLVFRACSTDSHIGYLAAKYAIETLEAGTAACIFCSDDDSSAGAAEAFASEFTGMGRSVVAFEGFPCGANDWTGQLETIAETGAEVIFIPGLYPDTASIAEQARMMGIDAQFIATPGWEGLDPFEYAPETFEGAVYVSRFDPEASNPLAREFVAAYRARYGTTPDILAALGYESAMILARIIGSIRNDDPAAIREALENFGMDSLMGWFMFDENRDPFNGGVIMEFIDGQAQYKQSIEPGYG